MFKNLWNYIDKNHPYRNLPNEGDKVLIYLDGTYYACIFENYNDTLEIKANFYSNSYFCGTELVASYNNLPEKWILLEKGQSE